MTLRSAQLPQRMVAAVVVQAMASLQRLSEVLVAASVRRALQHPQQAHMALVVGPAVVRQLESML